MQNRLLAVGTALLMSLPAFAQTPPDQNTQKLPYRVDSGTLNNAANQEVVVFSHTATSPGATWLQFVFDDATLPDGSYVRLTDHQEGLSQRLDIESVVTWNLTSAMFRGDTVTLELVAGPNTSDNRISISALVVGGPTSLDSICGTVDDRQLSSDSRQGRLGGGCTGWMVSPDIMLTAGHCTSSVGSNGTLHFNVPLSSGGGSTNPSAPNDQYPYVVLSRLNSGVGADWAVCRVSTNSNTGLLPTQANGGQWYNLGNVPTTTVGQTIRITGYGTVSSPVSPTWNQVQKTHTGPLSVLNPTSLRYRTDTTGGNSGSPVFHENTGTAVGIHTHAGCTSSGGSNQGTRIDRSDLVSALASVGVVIGGTPGGFANFGAGCPGTATGNYCAGNNTNGGTLSNTTAPNEYAYTASTGTAIDVVSFEVFSQSNSGSSETVDAAIYVENAGAPDPTPLATTTVTIGTSPGFYTASFASPVSIPAGTFYVSVDHSASTTVLANVGSGNPGGSFWRRPPLGGGSWSASGLVSNSSFRVNCLDICASNNPGGGTLSGTTAPNEYAYTASMTSAANVVAFDIYSESTSGSAETVGAAIYTDNGGSPDVTPLAQTTVTIGTTPGFYRATFAAPVSVPAGAFYISVDHSAGNTVLANLTSGNAGGSYWRRPPFGGGAWSPSGLVSNSSFVVYCGSTGGSAAIPSISGSGNPNVNQSFTTSLTDAAPSTLAGLMVGFSDTVATSGAPLPFNMGSFGAPRCDILVDPLLTYGALTNGSGTASRTLNVPNNPVFIGVDVFEQWYVIDSGANALGVSFSDGLKVTIGS